MNFSIINYKKASFKEAFFIIKIFCLVNFKLFASEFTIAPIMYSHYESSGKVWNVKDASIGLAGWGIAFCGQIDNLDISLDAYNNRFFGISNKPNYFSNDQGISWVGHDPGGEQFDFDVTNAKFEYNYKKATFQFGKFNKKWGPGESSLTLSNKSPSFLQFGLKYKINNNLQFEYFHGTLRSMIPDDSNIIFYDGIGEEKPELNRFIAGHRIEWAITQKLLVSASEFVIYGVREIDLLYLIPIAPFLSLQQYAGDLDNILWSLDAIWNLNQKLSLYGTFLIDEWKPSMTFDDINRNWFAYQIGLKLNNLLINNDSFIFEYNWTDHRVYRHQNPINDYYSHGYPIGFWAGPHAEEVLIHYILNKDSFTMLVGCSYAKRGELSDLMLEKQYNNIDHDRYSNFSETLSVLEIVITKEFINGFNLHFGLSNIDWLNGGLVPNNPDPLLLEDINKNSIMVGFSLNFDIFNQESRIHKNSIKKIVSI